MLQPEVFSSRIKPFLEPIHVNDNPNGPRMINVNIQFQMHFRINSIVISSSSFRFKIRLFAMNCVLLITLILNGVIKLKNNWEFLMICPELLIMYLILHSLLLCTEIYGPIMWWLRRVSAEYILRRAEGQMLFLYSLLYPIFRWCQAYENKDIRLPGLLLWDIRFWFDILFGHECKFEWISTKLQVLHHVLSCWIHKNIEIDELPIRRLHIRKVSSNYEEIQTLFN